MADLLYGYFSKQTPLASSVRPLQTVNPKGFSAAIIEKLGYYVYLLVDPRTEEVFYVGKGTGNRLFAHLNESSVDQHSSGKADRVKEIIHQGLQVRHLVHRHGLTEKEAFEVEASLIDFIGLTDLANKVHGYQSDYRRQMTLSEVVARYEDNEVDIREPAILFILRNLVKRAMRAHDLYEATHGSWPVGSRRNGAKYAFAIYNGIIGEVYQIKSWYLVVTNNSLQKRRDRWNFEGIVTEDLSTTLEVACQNISLLVLVRHLHTLTVEDHSLRWTC